MRIGIQSIPKKLFPILLWTAPAMVAGTTTCRIDISTGSRAILSNPVKLGAARNRTTGSQLALNSLYFVRDGHPWFPVMGEMHYSRYPRALWEDALLKMKGCGIDVVATYVFWIHHEEIEGQFNWSGNRDLRHFAQLCRKHGLFLFLRIGPWCHGEVRNGGFPDWLLSKGKLRSNDPAYLKLVGRWYNQIGQQVRDLCFQDDGPIIGVQLENEYAFKKPEKLQHLLTLKQMARAAGLDVPYYTATGWPAADTRQEELIPVYGGYPAAPWTQHTRPLAPSGTFLFGPVRRDPPARPDGIPPTPATYTGTRYPYATAEMGSGNQITYHRRPILSARDVVPLAYVRTGSGANLMGYYVFHGGSNPIGKRSTLQESRATGYPNDCPLISYDFYAPIGEWGQLRKSYREYKVFHYFLNDYGHLLAPTHAFFPKQRPAGPADSSTPRWAVRAEGDRGFIFVNNCQRGVNMPEKRDIQFTLTFDGGHALRIPRHPITVANDAVFIWPFNLDMGSARLDYATAQPLCNLATDVGVLSVFFAIPGIPPEYEFDAATVEDIHVSGDTGQCIRTGNRSCLTNLKPGLGCVARVRTKSGGTVRILTLTHRQALNAWRGRVLGRERLIVSACDVIMDESSIRFQQNGDPRMTWAMVPPYPLCIDGKPVRGRADGIFTRYEFGAPPRTLEVTFQPVPGPASKQQPAAAWAEELRKKSPHPLENAVALWNRERAGVCRFRKRVVIEGHGPIRYACLAFLADEKLDLWINGRKVGSGGSWNRLTVWDVQEYLRPGDNVIACRITNVNGPGGLLGRLFIRRDAWQEAATALDWRVTTQIPAHWRENDFDDSAWEIPIRVELDTHCTWKQTNAQPGPIYGPRYTPIPGAKTWRLHVPTAPLNGLADVLLDIRYFGDTAALYLDDRLVADDFFSGLPMRVGLERVGNAIGKGELLLQIVPLSNDRDIFFEPSVRERIHRQSGTELKSIRAVPRYEAIVTTGGQ